MKREETDVWFERNSDDKLIFNPKGESQPKFLFREFKNRLSYLRGEIASCEKNIDLLLGKKGEKKKEILNMIELEFFKRQLDIDREKFESIRNWFSQNKINEPGSLEEKFEKQQRNKILDTYIERLRQKITKELESAKGEKKDSTNALWAIADDVRQRKEDGEFTTYREGYRWAEKHITHHGNPIKAHNLERAYHKAKSGGKVD